LDSKIPRQPNANLSELATSPEWHLYDCDAGRLEFQLIRLEEDDYRRATFLDVRLGSLLDGVTSERVNRISRVFPKKVGGENPAAYIFHIGHCGSTLLSRALSETPAVLPLREPRTLKFLANQLRELKTPRCLLTEPQFRRLGVIILSALERRFSEQQLPLVKATSICNNLIGPILQTHRQRRAILLYQPLETYLAGRFKKTVSSDLRAQAQERFDEWLRIPAAPVIRLSELGSPELGALAWLTSMWRLRLVDEHINDQIVMVDFQDFLDQPDEQLERLAGFIGLAPGVAKALVDRYPEVASSYSKNPDFKFNSDMRQKELQLSRKRWAKQIARGMEWAQQMVAATPDLARCAPYFE
jgi:hypothetical protein